MVEEGGPEVEQAEVELEGGEGDTDLLVLLEEV